MNDENSQLLTEFGKVAVRHQNYAICSDQLSEAIEDTSDKSLIVLAGPTGGGKSTLAGDASTSYLKTQESQMEADPSLRPIIWTLATASDDIKFDFARLWRDTLTALDDPLAAIRQYRNDGRKGVPKFLHETPVAALIREVLEREFRNRGAKIWGIDEAHHVVRGGMGEPGDQLDVVKSVGQTASVRLVLVGTGDLPEYLFESGQLARRSSVICLNAYRFEIKEELGFFVVAMTNLLKRLPSHPTFPDPKQYPELYFIGSLGCIGTGKDWILRAYRLMLKEGVNKLTLKHLIKTRLAQRAIRKIHQEIILMQEQFQNDRKIPTSLRKAILEGKRETGEEGNYIPAPKNARRGKAHKPGDPNPIRHRVGTNWA